MYYEGPLRILKTETLSADEAEVEARFAALVQTRLDEIIAEYGARFGSVIDTDSGTRIFAGLLHFKGVEDAILARRLSARKSVGG